MLTIINRPEFDTTVPVRTAHTRGEFKARFVALPVDELRALELAAQAEGKGLSGILPTVTVSVSDFALPDGKPATLDNLLNYPGVGPAMVKAYYDGLWNEQQGNSERPSAGS